MLGLRIGRVPPLPLIIPRFSEEEMEGVVKKRFPNHRFDRSLLDYVYNPTSGHVGACCDALKVVKKNNVSLQSANLEYDP